MKTKEQVEAKMKELIEQHEFHDLAYQFGAMQALWWVLE